MANYIIHGTECRFPGVPYSVLAEYEPDHLTWCVLFRSNYESCTLFLLLYIQALHHLGLIDRLKPLTMEDGTQGYLFDYIGSKELKVYLEQFDTLAQRLCKDKYILIHPFRKEVHKWAQEKADAAAREREYLRLLAVKTPQNSRALAKQANLMREYELDMIDLFNQSASHNPYTGEARYSAQKVRGEY